MRTQTKTKTRSITNTKLAVATLVALAAGGAAFAMIPKQTFAPSPTPGRVANMTTSTITLVQSCTNLPSNGGVVVNRGMKVNQTYTNNCATINPRGEKNYLVYSCKSRTEMLTSRYEFCCRDWDGGNNPTVKGVVSNTFTAIAATDTCSLNGLRLDEAVCNANNLASIVNIPTPAGQICVDGRFTARPVATPPTVNVTLLNEPPSQNYLMSATDQVVANYQLTAGNTEDVIINSLTLGGLFSGQASTINMIKLFDEQNIPVGQAVAFFEPIQGLGANYARVIFQNLNLRVPKDTTKTIKIVVDFKSHEQVWEQTTGQTFTTFILSDNSSIGAVGAYSGIVSTVTIPSNAVGNQPRGLYGPTATLYRTKISVAWSLDTPTGMEAPAREQIVGKFVVNNFPNGGGYRTIIKNININLTSTIINSTSTPHQLKIYRDNLDIQTLLSTYTFAAGQPFGNIQIPDGNFTDVEIASGNSKTFYITLDTMDAKANNSLSLRPNIIFWSDGITSSIADTDSLNYKTLVY